MVSEKQAKSASDGPASNPVVKPVSRFANYDFERIDKHAKNAPKTATQSLKSLAEYLASGATSELEKVRAVYKWVTSNIKYDHAGLKGTSPKMACDAESVLKNRVCVCAGYAAIVDKLIGLVGMEGKQLTGLSKGSRFNSIDPVPLELGGDHAWNAVKLDGQWQFIEATWAVSQGTDAYFLTDPEVFINDHFPHNSELSAAENQKWQLLDKPIDIKTFQKRALRTMACYEQQVELVSHTQSAIEVQEEVTLKFRGTGKPLTSFGAKLLNPRTEQELSCGRYVATILDHHANEATVIVRPPNSLVPYWELAVHGSTNRSSVSNYLVSYQLQPKLCSLRPVFPDLNWHYGLQILPQTESIVKSLEIGAATDFFIQVKGGIHELQIPMSLDMVGFAHLQFAADREPDKRACATVMVLNKFIQIHLRMNRVGFYALELFCRKANSVTGHMVACFLVQCLSCTRGLLAFPDCENAYGARMELKKFGFTDEAYRQSFVIRTEVEELEIALPTSQAITSNLKFTTADGSKAGLECRATNDKGSFKIKLKMKTPGFHKLDLYCKKLGDMKNVCWLAAGFLVEFALPCQGGDAEAASEVPSSVPAGAGDLRDLLSAEMMASPLGNDPRARERVKERVGLSPASTTDLVNLAQHLASAATSDHEKALAVYTWVTENITFDHDGQRGRRTRMPCDAQSVLRNRLCVAEGFAEMVRCLCLLLGLECKKISGFCKAVNYDTLYPMSSLEGGANHVWNVVKLDGSWRFIDATRGSGRVFQSEVFAFEGDFFFLADPHVFSVEYFPLDEAGDAVGGQKWQLLDEPVDLESWQWQARRSAQCFELQVELVSHTRAVIEVREQVKLKFRGAGKPLTDFGADFIDSESGKAVSSGSHVVTILDHSKNEATVVARPPTSDRYWELKVYCKTEGASYDKYYLVVYHLRAEFSSADPIFPNTKRHYGLQCGPETAQLTQQLAQLWPSGEFWIQVEGGKHELVIPVPQRMDAIARLRSGDNGEPDIGACATEVRGKQWRISLRLTQTGFYTLELLTRGKDSEFSLAVARFLVECASCDPELPQFPQLDAFCGAHRDPEKFGFSSRFQDRGFIVRVDGGECELALPTAQPVNGYMEFRSAEDDNNDWYYFAENEKGQLKVSLRIYQAGFHKLQLFYPELGSSDASYPLIATFLIECTEPMQEAKEFPMMYYFAMGELVTLESPRDRDLPEDTEVCFKLRSPTVVKLLVNNNEYKSSGSGFDFTMNTGAAGQELHIYGKVDPDAEFEDMYSFYIVEAE